MNVGEAGAAADGPEGDAILWTMANRLYLLRNEPLERRDGELSFPPHRYAWLLRAYSQPINPYWLDPRHESDAARLRRRIQIASLGPNAEWNGMPVENATRRVVAFMQGKTENRYAGIVHFGEAGREEFIREHGTPETMPFMAANWFWKCAATRGWTRDTLVPLEPSAGSDIVPALVVGAGLVAAYLLIRRATGSSWLGLGAALPFVPP
jgi:hypothetical protein